MTKCSQPNCRMRCLKGEVWCLVHHPSPEVRAKLAAARSAGGKTKRTVPKRDHHGMQHAHSLYVKQAVKAELQKAGVEAKPLSNTEFMAKWGKATESGDQEHAAYLQSQKDYEAAHPRRYGVNGGPMNMTKEEAEVLRAQGPIFYKDDVEPSIQVQLDYPERKPKL